MDGSGLSLELRIGLMTMVLLILAILLSVAFVALAVGAEMWGMLAGVPVAILGGVLVVGSIWVAFMTNNAISA